MILTKIVITNLHEKKRKLSFIMSVKSLEIGRFWNIMVALFKISNSDSLGVNKAN